MTKLWCYDNQLKSLDVSGCIALTDLDCDDNQLTGLDVSALTALTELLCSSNQLTSLDVSANTALTLLFCNNNQLGSLDVSANTVLEYLLCNNNQLTSLDVSANTALVALYCYNNGLADLDLSKNKDLIELYCAGNPIRNLVTPGGITLAIPPTSGAVLGTPGDDTPWGTNNFGFDFQTGTVTLTAVAGSDRTFENWRISPDTTLTAGKVTDTQISFVLSQDTTVTPWFKYTILTPPATYTGSNAISFTVSGEPAYYDKTTVNGNAAPTTQQAGSTIVTFADDYLKTLANGTYAVQALYTDGYADTTLAVNAPGGSTPTTPTTPTTVTTTTTSSSTVSARTGDESNLSLWIMLCAIAGAAVAGAVAYHRRRTQG